MEDALRETAEAVHGVATGGHLERVLPWRIEHGPEDASQDTKPTNAAVATTHGSSTTWNFTLLWTKSLSSSRRL